MAVKFSNNAATTLASGISSGATSFTVASVANFPTLGAGDWTYVSLTTEVVKVTAINTGTKAFTCVATSGAHLSGITVELRMTAELLNDFAEDTEADPVGTAVAMSIALG
jgi:predicted regulator of Ras-like GTPase activity (Roadblock/LC7/MglB family)